MNDGNFFNRIINIFEIIARNLGVISFIIMFLLVLVQVILRFIFGISAYYTFLLAQVFVIFVAFINSSVAFIEKEKGHVRIDYFFDKCSVKTKIYGQFFINIIMFVISLLIFVGSLLSVFDVWGIARAGIPWLSRGWFYVPVVVGTFFNMIFIIKWSIEIIYSLKDSETNTNTNTNIKNSNI